MLTEVAERVIDHDVSGSRLYPDLSMAQKQHEQIGQQVTLKPFTDEQLASLYYNYELHNNKIFIDKFLKVC